MTHRARLYIAGVILAGAILARLVLDLPPPTTGDWVAFLVLAVLASCAQLLKAIFQSQPQSDKGATAYSPAFILFFAGVLLLPPSLFVILVLIPHTVEWLRENPHKTAHLTHWYVQPFNIATHLISGLVAQQVYLALGFRFFFPPLPAMLIALLGAAATYLLLNHALVGLVLIFARGVTWSESGVLERENLSSDSIMIIMGAAAALLWMMNPWFMPLALAPLIPLQRSLVVPQLRKEARIDSKTGLWNARHFAELFKAEFGRASRFGRPLAVLMADLDLLRNINNTYGHLAGDTVLAGVGEIIRRTVREYDIAARFGGEEFTIALPETRLQDATGLAERLRSAVEAAEFQVSTSRKPIHATLSVGVSCYPADGSNVNDLIHVADIAVYQAKLRGRNRVVPSSDLPRSIALEAVGSGGDQRMSQSGSTYHDSQIRDGLRHTPEAILDEPFVDSASGADGRAGASEFPAALLPAPEPSRNNGSSTHEETSSPTGRVRGNHPKESVTSRTSALFNIFFTFVVSSGLVVFGYAIFFGRIGDSIPIAVLTALAVAGEFFQVHSEDSSVSTSVAANFAAALSGGVPGLLFTSTAIALAHRLRPNIAWNKTVFNWSSHVLAGLVPVLIMRTAALTVNLQSLPALLGVAIGGGLLYFFIETGLISVAISLSRNERLLVIWDQNFRWLAAHYVALCLVGLLTVVAYSSLGVIGMLIFASPLLMMRYSLIQYVNRTRDSLQELKRMNEQLEQANSQVVLASHSISELNEELFLTLSKIIDARDPFVAGHALQVALYAGAVAQEMQFSKERSRQLRRAALLHDIGKLGISELILNKPAKLSPSEYENIKTHASLGGDFLETSQGLRHLGSFVKYHHERWDGTGYPEGLSGNQIPLEARILAVCDAVEAMASDRPYHRAMSPSEIIAEIERCSGTQFDPNVVQIFTRIARREGSRLIVNSAREVERRQDPGSNGHRISIESQLNDPQLFPATVDF